ncbi:hypothetical protein L209DRAFT_578094 [Thermothelomyces heterothallicus CBS 203.75]
MSSRGQEMIELSGFRLDFQTRPACNRSNGLGSLANPPFDKLGCRISFLLTNRFRVENLKEQGAWSKLKTAPWQDRLCTRGTSPVIEVRYQRHVIVIRTSLNLSPRMETVSSVLEPFAHTYLTQLIAPVADSGGSTSAGIEATRAHERRYTDYSSRAWIFQAVSLRETCPKGATVIPYNPAPLRTSYGIQRRHSQNFFWFCHMELPWRNLNK